MHPDLLPISDLAWREFLRTVGLALSGGFLLLVALCLAAEGIRARERRAALREAARVRGTRRLRRGWTRAARALSARATGTLRPRAPLSAIPARMRHGTDHDRHDRLG